MLHLTVLCQTGETSWPGAADWVGPSMTSVVCQAAAELGGASESSEKRAVQTSESGILICEFLVWIILSSGTIPT